MLKDIFSKAFSVNRRRKEVQERMDSIINSTLSELDFKVGASPWTKSDPNYEEAKEEWAFDPRRKQIKYPIEGVKSIDALSDYDIISILLHEIAHALFTEDITHINIPDPKYAYIQMVNMFEDVRIEKKLMQKYPGTYDSLSHIFNLVESGITDAQLKQQPDYMNFLMNVAFKEWGRPLRLKKKVEPFFKKVEKDIEESFDAHSTMDLVNNHLNDKIWAQIVELIEDEPNQKPQQNPNAGGGKGDNDGDNKQDQQQGQNNDDGDDEQEQDQESNPEHDTQNSDVKQMIRDLNKNDKLEGKPQDNPLDNVKTEKPKGKGGQQEKEEEEAQKNSQPTIKNPGYDEERQDRLDELEGGSSKVFAGDDTDKDSYYTSFLTYEELYESVQDQIQYFARRLGSILEDNRMIRQGGSFRSGKLNTKKLYNWKCGNPRLFSRPIMRMHRDYSVTLLIDESGSMCGDEILQAARTSVLMAEVLHKVGIPFEVVGFNTDYRTYKHLDEPFTWVHKRNMESIMLGVNTHGAGYTNDAFSINCAAHRLNKRTGEKIMLVMTDGGSNIPDGEVPREHRARLPQAKRDYDDFELVTEVKKAGQTITVIGVGIGYNQVHGSYDKSAVVEDVSQLAPHILRLIKSNIKRG